MLSFTQEERRAILFLVSIALFGLGINCLTKHLAVVRTVFCLNANLGKVNLNKADQDGLMLVPGIGEKLAQRIIAYRAEKNRFHSIEELKNIPGFKGYRFEQVKTMLYVE